MKHQHKGFTIIELTIVVAVIGTLTAIALPSYNEYIQRGHRAEARAGLLQAAQWLERAATANGTYPLTSAFPASLQKVPSNRYDIGLASANGSGYALTAAPKGAQITDRCGNYTLDQAGLKGAKGVTTGTIVTECWSK